MTDFESKLQAILQGIGPENLKYNEDEAWMYQPVYDFIWQYACEKELQNTALALPIVRSLHDGVYRGVRTAPDGVVWERPYFCHSLSVCRMLINLQPPLSSNEEDILLAAALCHDLRVYIPFPEGTGVMTTRFHLDPRVAGIMDLIYEGNHRSDEKLRRIFDRVREDRLATLVRLSDRSNIVEELHQLRIWKAHEFIRETRAFYLPMCIYARENYPELDASVGVLQEKMRELLESAEIFVSRFETMEKEFTTRILAMEEDNARMRTLIRKRRFELENEEPLT